jgi:hypothetical protein
VGRDEGYNLTVADESPNGSDPAEPFKRFEELTKRIVSVPKSEVDARRKKEQQERRRAAARRTTS